MIEYQSNTLLKSWIYTTFVSYKNYSKKHVNYIRMKKYFMNKINQFKLTINTKFEPTKQKNIKMKYLK